MQERSRSEAERGTIAAPHNYVERKSTLWNIGSCLLRVGFGASSWPRNSKPRVREHCRGHPPSFADAVGQCRAVLAQSRPTLQGAQRPNNFDAMSMPGTSGRSGATIRPSISLKGNQIKRRLRSVVSLGMVNVQAWHFEPAKMVNSRLKMTGRRTGLRYVS